MDFTFPTLPPVTSTPLDQQQPLTARSTVVHASSSGRGPSAAGGGAADAEAAAQPGGSTPQQRAAPVAVRQVVAAEGRRNKVPLEKGFSQVDWLKLTRSGVDLKGGAGLRRDIPLAEVQQHSAADDAWMVLHGKVYNITPYLSFHPGGPEILVKAAGRDGTSLFNRYHPWVNAHALLDKCLLGSLAPHDGGAGGGTKSRLAS